MSTHSLSPAERFPTFAEYATSTASLPQTAATSLDAARLHAFTGEMTFSIDPAVRLYLDGGSVYHAERDGDPPVCRLLLDAGVVDSTQLQRGVVRVGDVEHLGRLFDRDPTIDRDAVMVVVEGATDAIVQQIADSVVATITVSAYRHHPSGIHRWFVAPVESNTAQRPSSGVMQVDRSVVEDLPRLGAPLAPPDVFSSPPVSPDAPMIIEWADPDPADLAPPAAGDFDIDIQAELDRFDADHADWAAASGGNDPDPSESVPSPLGEFRIVWPDGTRDESIVSATQVDLEPPPPPPPVVEPEAMPTPASPPAVTDLSAPVGAVPEAPAPDSGFFTMKPLQIDRIPEPDAAVPDDVAAAVRRALQAIERAADIPTSTTVPELNLAPVIVPAPATPPPAPAPAPAPAGFAPPTMAMRAEAVYERAATEVTTHPEAVAEAVVGDAEASHPAPGRASVVFVEDEDDDGRERRGALRRLIGSLRSKD